MFGRWYAASVPVLLGLALYASADLEVCEDGDGCDEVGLLQLSRHRVNLSNLPGPVRKWLTWSLGNGLQGGCRRKDTHRKADATNGPTLDPLAIPQFVTPLVIPPVMESSGPEKYEIAVRQFQQQILPGGIWNNPVFANYNGGKEYDFPATTVWSFGPADNEEPDSSDLGGRRGVAPAANSQFNYPAYTVETVAHVPQKVDWINHLVQNPWRCNWRDPPKCFGKWRILNALACCRCRFLRHVTPVDKSLHWANPGRLPCKSGVRKPDCTPKDSFELKSKYEGPVPISIHLHGAHAEPESDGYPEAWFLPDASNIPRGYARHGTLTNRFGPGRKTNRKRGVASFEYRNDQPTAALWFHDHTLGMTRNNVYAGPAGFWLIRKADGGEDGLVSGVLPHPAPKAGESLQATNLPPFRNKYREIPIVIQDRSFNDDGSLWYPGDRAYFEGVEVSQLQIPLLGDWERRTDVPPIWNPEVFFDTIVVNGVTWPVLEVEPDIYRFRLLNGCNSRTLNLLMYTVDESGAQLEEVPFYQIGGDQSLLPQVVKITKGFATALPGDGTEPAPTPSQDGEGVLMGPAYRVDVLVDFRLLPKGTVVQIFNTGPDGPFGGFPVEVPAKAETTAKIMQFRVIDDDDEVGEDATPPQNIQLTLVDAEDPANEPEITNVRNISLNEFNSQKVCVITMPNGDIVWDSSVRPISNDECADEAGQNPNGAKVFAPLRTTLGVVLPTEPPTLEGRLWSDPIFINPELNATETWAFWDGTADSHPMHVHLVKFRVLGRRLFDATALQLGPFEPAPPTDAGWKDTVIVDPGYVTYVKARFDIAGLYVTHCHVLEHEDQEMMVPYCVGDLDAAPGCPVAEANAMPHSAV